MKVKELMTSVSEYMTFEKNATLSDVVVSLAESKHRDVLVVNDSGDLEGILTMTDILGAIEPSYKKLQAKDLDKDTLTNRYVADIFKEFGLWADTLEDLCKKGCSLTVADVMHTLKNEEFLNEDDALENGVHHYIMGAHQPLIVRKNGEVTGILRLNDVVEEIQRRMVACACEQ